MGVALKERPLTFRRKQKHELSELLKELKREGPEALERMAELAKDKDTDAKTKFNANKSIIDAFVEVTKLVNTDEITRTLGELKHNANGPRELEEDDTPQIDFNEIQDV